jgi:hypothetical protein
VVGAACCKRRLHPAPYLLALATCSNIGSACSPIGNPQNMIVALLSGVTFLQFLACIGAASVVGTAVNTAFIAWTYRPWVLGGQHYDWTPQQAAAVAGADGAADGARSHPGGGGAASGRSAAATAVTPRGGLLADDTGVAHDVGGAEEVAVAGQGGDGSTRVGECANGIVAGSTVAKAMPGGIRAGEFDAWVDGEPPAGAGAAVTAAMEPPQPRHAQSESGAPPIPSAHEGEGGELPQWRRRAMLGVLALTPVALLVADRWIGLGWMTLLAAAVLILLDGRPPDQQLVRVDGMLLLFFSGLFIVVAGFNATGVPEAAWASISPAVSMHTAAGLALYTAIILVGSNTVSNVPLVLLLAPKLLQATGNTALVYWTELAWISTVAGNLTLLGSVANLIVAERCKGFYPVRFVEYLRVGAPTTVALCLAGVPVVRAVAMALPA